MLHINFFIFFFLNLSVWAPLFLWFILTIVEQSLHFIFYFSVVGIILYPKKKININYLHFQIIYFLYRKADADCNQSYFTTNDKHWDNQPDMRGSSNRFPNKSI